MNLSRWLPVSVFAIAVVAAWQFAQPPAPQTSPASQPATAVPGNPYDDAVNTRQLIPQRLIVAPPEPLKFSDIRPE